MNTFLRWGKFNLVGAMGMGVQLPCSLFSTAGGWPLSVCLGCGHRTDAIAQLHVAFALHMARPP